MGEKIGNVVAIKRYFECKDKIAPSGGQQVVTKELTALSKEARAELGALALAELEEMGENIYK